MEETAWLFGIELEKWTRMVVIGETITTDQAAEIILRTSGLMFITNDKDWERQLYEKVGLGGNEENMWKQVKYAKDLLGVLDLEYLVNRQIASSSICGPNGWCHWNGSIYADYNIGKWPTVSEVLREWKLISSEWPFLQLRCQLFNEEDVQVEFVINNGNVALKCPLEKLQTCEDDIRDLGDLLSHLMTFNERGCTIEQFTHAINLAQKCAK